MYRLQIAELNISEIIDRLSVKYRVSKRDLWGSNSTERKKAKNDKRNDKKSSDCLRRALNRIKGGMYMKMRTRIISLSILAILTVCLLNVAAASATTPTAAPHSKIATVVNTDSKVKLVGNTLLLHASPSSNVNSGGTVYFSGYLTDTNGHGIGGQHGSLTANGQQMWSFQTASDGSWGPLGITFYGAGTRNVAVNCDGLQAVLEIQVS
jgi:hypothetical protein